MIGDLVDHPSADTANVLWPRRAHGTAVLTKTKRKRELGSGTGYFCALDRWLIHSARGLGPCKLSHAREYGGVHMCAAQHWQGREHGVPARGPLGPVLLLVRCFCSVVIAPMVRARCQATGGAYESAEVAWAPATWRPGVLRASGHLG